MMGWRLSVITLPVQGDGPYVRKEQRAQWGHPARWPRRGTLSLQPVNREMRKR